MASKSQRASTRRGISNNKGRFSLHHHLLGTSLHRDSAFGPSLEPVHGKLMFASHVSLSGHGLGWQFAWQLGRCATSLMPLIASCVQRLEGDRIMKFTPSIEFLYALRWCEIWDILCRCPFEYWRLQCPWGHLWKQAGQRIFIFLFLDPICDLVLVPSRTGSWSDHDFSRGGGK